MLLTEVLNLYKLSKNPEDLKGFDQTKPIKGKVIDKPISVKIGRSNITFPYKIIKTPDEPSNTELARLLNREYGKPAANWDGKPEEFSWDSFPVQREHYKKLKAFLAKHGMKFTYMWYVAYESHVRGRSTPATMHWFIAVVGDPKDAKFVWYKYGGYDPQSGQNWIYPGGKKIQTSAFYHLKPAEQDVLMRGPPTEDSVWKVEVQIALDDGRDIKRFYRIKSKSEKIAERMAKEKAKETFKNTVGAYFFVMPPIRIS